jgi:hypothetical protein
MIIKKSDIGIILLAFTSIILTTGLPFQIANYLVENNGFLYIKYFGLQFMQPMMMRTKILKNIIKKQMSNMMKIKVKKRMAMHNEYQNNQEFFNSVFYPLHF